MYEHEEVLCTFFWELKMCLTIYIYMEYIFCSNMVCKFLLNSKATTCFPVAQYIFNFKRSTIIIIISCCYVTEFVVSWLFLLAKNVTMSVQSPMLLDFAYKRCSILHLITVVRTFKLVLVVKGYIGERLLRTIYSSEGKSTCWKQICLTRLKTESFCSGQNLFFPFVVFLRVINFSSFKYEQQCGHSY